LLGPECYEASHRPALILLFAKKFFRSAFGETNEVDRTNILAPGF